jgi:TRAP-type C4-dicarboxylate transport system permease small subunit
MSLLRRAETALDRLLRFVVGAIMILAVLINFANVVARYVFLRPFIWAEETMQFLNVWAVLLGAAVVTRMDSHLRMDALHHAISPAARRVLDALGGVLAVAVALYIIVQSVDMIRMLAATGQRSVIARVPMNLMYLAIPLGFASGALFAVLRIRWRRRSRRAAEAAAAPESV